MTEIILHPSKKEMETAAYMWSLMANTPYAFVGRIAAAMLKDVPSDTILYDHRLQIVVTSDPKEVKKRFTAAAKGESIYSQFVTEIPDGVGGKLPVILIYGADRRHKKHHMGIEVAFFKAGNHNFPRALTLLASDMKEPLMVEPTCYRMSLHDKYGNKVTVPMLRPRYLLFQNLLEFTSLVKETEKRQAVRDMKTFLVNAARAVDGMPGGAYTVGEVKKMRSSIATILTYAHERLMWTTQEEVANWQVLGVNLGSSSTFTEQRRRGSI